MGFLDALFGKKKEPVTEIKKVVQDEPVDYETLTRLVNLIKDHAKEAIRYEIVEKETGLFDSKVGGPYYLPEGMEVPEANGEKLALLAQVNLGTQPHLEGFPETGLLQFFIGAEDNWGLSFKQGEEGHYAVRYIKEIPDTEDVRIIEDEDPDLPIEEGFTSLALVPKKVMSLPHASANEYMMIFKEAVPELLEEERWGLSFKNGLLDEQLFETIASLEGYVVEGSLMGGYPFFTQYDIRAEGEYEVLLFQLDSDMKHVMWGDCGVGNFFIDKEKLKELDFSDIRYNWDCC